MAEVSIQYGMGHDSAYIGIQPPLSPEWQGMLDAAHESDDTIPTGFSPKGDFEKGEPYSQYITPVSSHNSDRVQAETYAFNTAEKIAEVFRSNGLDVDFDDYPQSIGGPHFLFGCKTAPARVS